MGKHDLIGIGVYTASEASSLTGVPSGKLRRWLCGHLGKKRFYEPLWKSQIAIGDDGLYLGFRDLTEARIVSAFIKYGLSAQKVRRAIDIAREEYKIDRPLSTSQFRTDGKGIFLQIAREDQDDELVNLFTKQLQLKKIVEPSLRDLDFNSFGEPTMWHIDKGIVVDPARSFGQPIEVETSMPTAVLSQAAQTEGSVLAASKAWLVPQRAIKRAIAFEQRIAA